MSDSPATLPLAMIVRNPDAIRQVNRKDEKFVGLVDSIRARGVLQAVLVRPAPDGSGKYLLIDGDHRFTAAEEAGLENIPVKVVDGTDEDAYEMQYITNFHRIDTKPAEYGRHLTRILGRNPRLTASDLAAKLGQSTSTIMQRLKLSNLTEDIAALVDGNVINLSNAVALAGLPQEEQANFLDGARTMNSNEFKPLVEARVKEIRKAKREGREAAPVSAEFAPQPHLRKLGEITAAFENTAIISSIPGVTDVASAKAAIDWVLKMDPEAVAAAKAADAERKAKREADKAKIQQERDAKKLAEQEKILADKRKALESAPVTA